MPNVPFDWCAPTSRPKLLRGIARTARFAKSKRGLWLFAETSSRDPYARARAFYQGAGFTEVARFEDFYASGDAKVIFRLKL